jgi:hypothetical protein
MLRNIPLQPILDLLDEGLLIYRRGFVRFSLIVVIGTLIVTLSIGLLAALAAYAGSGWSIVAFMIGLPLVVLVLIIGAGAISRSTIAIRLGEPLRLGEAFRFGARRTVGMGCFSIIFLILVNIVSSVLSCVCIVPIFFLIGSVGALASPFGVGSDLNPALVAVAIVLFAVLIVFVYGFSLLVSGATYGSFVYGLQSFALETGSAREAMGLSFALLFYRFGYNLFTFVITGLAFAAMAGVVTIAISVLLPLPLIIALGAEAPLAQAVSGFAWLLGIAIAMPLMPIWMALLYKENAERHYGSDLAERIATLAASRPQQ